MHETGIAVEIFQGALSATGDRGSVAPIRLIRVQVAVGELSSIDPKVLKQAWKSVVSKSAHEKAELEVTWCPVRQLCPSCNAFKASAENSTEHICPDCHGPLAPEGGRELDLETVEFEEIGRTQPQMSDVRNH